MQKQDKTKIQKERCLIDMNLYRWYKNCCKTTQKIYEICNCFKRKNCIFYRIMNNRSRRLYLSQYKAIHGVKNEFKVCKLFSLIIIFIFTTSDIYSPSGENCQPTPSLGNFSIIDQYGQWKKSGRIVLLESCIVLRNNGCQGIVIHE